MSDLLNEVVQTIGRLSPQAFPVNNGGDEEGSDCMIDGSNLDPLVSFSDKAQHLINF